MPRTSMEAARCWAVGCALWCAAGAHGQVPGDWNGDGAVDGADLAGLEQCMTGPTGTVGSGCAPFDLGGRGVVDLASALAFQGSTASASGCTPWLTPTGRGYAGVRMYGAPFLGVRATVHVPGRPVLCPNSAIPAFNATWVGFCLYENARTVFGQQRNTLRSWWAQIGIDTHRNDPRDPNSTISPNTCFYFESTSGAQQGAPYFIQFVIPAFGYPLTPVSTFDPYTIETIRPDSTHVQFLVWDDLGLPVVSRAFATPSWGTRVGTALDVTSEVLNREDRIAAPGPLSGRFIFSDVEFYSATAGFFQPVDQLSRSISNSAPQWFVVEQLAPDRFEWGDLRP